MKLTKTELRIQQLKLDRNSSKYLPTLQLKKAMLQLEVNHRPDGDRRAQRRIPRSQEKVGKYSALLTERRPPICFCFVKVLDVEKAL